jgi:acyl dehydratase
MKKLWGEEEINKAKADKSIRDKMKADFEEMIEIGKPHFYSVDADEFPYRIGLRVVTEDAIRQFCDGIGDVNPLYRNRDYAKNSVYGEIIAPPHFLNTVAHFGGKGIMGMTPFGYTVAAFDVGPTTEWFKVIRLGDEFKVIEIPTKVTDLTREGTPVQFLCCADKVYKNQRDEILAIVNSNIMHIVVSPAREAKLKEPEKLHYFSERDVEDWLKLIEQEEIRGAEPRFWEDVNVGDQVPPTHHVFTMMETVAFTAGVVKIGGSWRFAMALYMRIMGEGDWWKRMLDPESGLPDLGGLHMTDTAAQRMGSPRANCAGVHLGCWLGHLVTNWMGDTGFLKKLSVQIRRSLYRESLAVCKGEVVKKYVEDSEHRVDLKITLEDHNGTLVVPNGLATVVLPSRHIENWRSQVVLSPRDLF